MAVNKANDKLYFDGVGDVTSFVEKIDLVSGLKGHADEQKARFIASKLGASAFDVYRRLSIEDKKNPETIKTELLKEFCREERNREEALQALMCSKRQPGESTKRFAYRILRLVGLAYSSLDANTKQMSAKDFYVKGLSRDLQVALKSTANFANQTLNALSDESTRLEIAGVKSEAIKFECAELRTEEEIVSKVTKNVIDQLKAASLNDADEEVTFIENKYRQNYRNRTATYRGNNIGRPYNQRGSRDNTRSRVCRTCQSSAHLFRECPVRFCQACGRKGHDAWNTACPNYS